MSLDDANFLVKIQVKISKMTVFQRRNILNQFEKWRVTRASIDGVGSVLVWVAWVAHLCGKRASMIGMGGVGDVLAWVKGQRVQRAQGGRVCVDDVLTWWDVIVIMAVIIEILSRKTKY